ncbi:MAG: hypothetical protein HYT37_01420 [Candidatus Sungbacteria bacterium]|nr:hypothetical protein [Candidatus Sungbacteria bacterium]
MDQEHNFLKVAKYGAYLFVVLYSLLACFLIDEWAIGVVLLSLSGVCWCVGRLCSADLRHWLAYEKENRGGFFDEITGSGN